MRTSPCQNENCVRARASLHVMDLCQGPAMEAWGLVRQDDRSIYEKGEGHYR